MKRRKAREYALQFLYAIDFMQISGDKRSEILRGELDVFWHEADEKDKEIIKFAEEIILGTIDNYEAIDSIVQSTAENWKLRRMAAIDRNILRFAVYEILYKKDIPFAVTMNEAIEIAKTYSSLESASFINGILDKIAKDLSLEKDKIT